jgi:hypothetical protein
LSPLGGRPLLRFVWTYAAHEGIALRVLEELEGQVHVKIRPVEMMWASLFDSKKRAHRSILKPREFGERDKVLSIGNE